jgi:hypothetical protein
MLPSNRNPVLFLWISSVLMRLVTVSNKIGYIFLDLILIERVSINHKAIYWTGSPYSSSTWPNG